MDEDRANQDRIEKASAMLIREYPAHKIGSNEPTEADKAMARCVSGHWYSPSESPPDITPEQWHRLQQEHPGLFGQHTHLGLALVDCLTDLRHLAFVAGENWSKITEEVEMHFRAEIDEGAEGEGCEIDEGTE